jgi:type VI secretion system protein ImpM
MYIRKKYKRHTQEIHYFPSDSGSVPAEPAAPARITPGFFGKLPASGDFVGRGLPAAFTTPWDRWLARHLVPRLAADAPSLFFHHPGPPAFAGVVLPSHDRAGRRFPLTLAVPCQAPPTGHRDQGLTAEFFTTLATLGQAAIAEALPPDALATRLAALALPAPAPSPRFLLWTDPAAPQVTDPAAPGPVLDALLQAPAGTP